MGDQLIPFDVYKKIFPNGDNRIPALLNSTLPEHNITTLNRVSSFLAQCGHESAEFRLFEEGLNYSAEALMRIWPRHFNWSLANQVARNPEAIANIAYANRMGNGPPSSGEGWKFRGRGVIQLTGKENYQSFARWKKISLDEAIGYVKTLQGGVDAALWFWKTRNLNASADREDLKAQTKTINGGDHGIDHRIELYVKSKNLLADSLGSGEEYRILSVHDKPRIKISKTFYRDEFECSPTWCSCGYDTVDVLLIYVMQKISDTLDNRKIKIIHGARCEKFNRMVKGVFDSQHLIGKGCDFEIPEYGKHKKMSSDEIISLIKQLFGSTVWCYAMSDDIVHLDVRGPKENKNEIKISSGLTRGDFACKCGNCYHDTADVALVRVVENITHIMNRPVKVTSANRCPSHNQNIGGAPRSQHPLGKACDIQYLAIPEKGLPDARAEDIMAIIKQVYGDFIWCYAINERTVHIDVRYL